MSSISELELTETMNGSLNHFLTSLKGGNDALSSFLGYWMSLNDTLQRQRDYLPEETLANAYDLATKIDTIASSMLEIDSHVDLMQHQLAKDLSYILNDDMENLVIRDEFPISTGHGSTPPYIRPCSQWLLANLHNPYPPKSIRNSICRQTGSSIKDLDAWFTDARKRIGWNHLRRTHFSNRREKIIDAATTFFKPSREFLKLDPSSQNFQMERSDNHSMVFVEMEERAQRLFSDKFEETPLARTLDHAVQDSPLLSQIQNEPGLQHQQDTCTLKPKRHAYPSPERSPERSLEPQALSLIAVPSPIPLSTVSHKRRRSSSEPLVDDVSLDRQQKRLRSKSAQNFDEALAAASLPSPAPSLNEVSSPAGNESVLLSSTTPPALPITPVVVSAPPPPAPSTKRKRHCSDSEDRRPSKYLQPAPLSRIASNPLPMQNNLLHESSLEDILQDYLVNQSFSHDIPPAIFSEVLDDSIPVDVNYYQYSLSPVVLDNSLQPDLIFHKFNWLSPAPVQETSELSPSFELNRWVDGPHGSDMHGLLNAENSIYTTDLNPLLLEPDYFQFSGLPTLDVPSIPTSSTFDWMAFATQPISHHSALKRESGVVLNQTSPIPNIDYQSTAMERVAKRHRAELLRAELQRLEADID